MSKFSEFLRKNIVGGFRYCIEKSFDRWKHVHSSLDKGFCEVALEFGNTYNNCGQWRLFAKLSSVFSHHKEDSSDDRDEAFICKMEADYMKRFENNTYVSRSRTSKLIGAPQRVEPSIFQYDSFWIQIWTQAVYRVRWVLQLTVQLRQKLLVGAVYRVSSIWQNHIERSSFSSSCTRWTIKTVWSILMTIN